MKTDHIIPAVIPESYKDIIDHTELAEAYVKTIQIDLLDGLYTGSYSWPWDTKGRLSHSIDEYVADGLPFWEKVDYEFDCMIVHPTQILEKLIPLGPRRIVVHAKTLNDLEKDVAYLQTFQPFIELGIAFTIEDDLEKYKNIIDAFDYIQCMGVYPVGASGAPFQERTFDLISAVRAIAPEKIIQVDGGVSLDTIADLKEAGASRFVSASSVFNEGLVGENIRELEEQITEE